MSKVRLTGSNSGYVEITAVADAGNLTFTMPTSGTALLGNNNNVFSGITTTGQLDINGSIDVSSTSVFNDDVTLTGGSYNVVWDKSDNQLEFGDNAKLSFGDSLDLQIYHAGSSTQILNNNNHQLYISSDNALNLTSRTGQEYFFRGYLNGAAELYFNNSKKIETTNTGAVVTGICTATSFSGSGEGLTRTTQLSHRNIIINGAMNVAQRGGVAGAHNSFAVDRFKFKKESTAANFDMTQSTTSPDGFSNSLKVDCTSADTSTAHNEFVMVRYAIEARDLQQLGYGTASAKPMVLSFYVRSSLTGTYSINCLQQDNSSKIYSRTYTINSANTWERKTISIPADTSGVINDDSGEGLQFNFNLVLGSSFKGSAVSTAWETYANNKWGSQHGINLASSTSNEWYITGVQLEVGSVATPFEHRSFSEELVRCQRYYEHSYNYSVTPGTAVNNGSVMFLTNRSPGTAHTMLRFQTRKRANPTVIAYDPTQSNTTGMRNLDDNVTYGYTANRMGQMGCTAYPTGSLNLGRFIQFHYTADAEL